MQDEAFLLNDGQAFNLALVHLKKVFDNVIISKLHTYNISNSLIEMRLLACITFIFSSFPPPYDLKLIKTT
jgi:hypothetical protein